MKRKLFMFATVVSLVMCVGTVVLWVRSYWRWDTIGLTKRYVFVAISSQQGIIHFDYQRNDGRIPYDPKFFRRNESVGYDEYNEMRWRRWGFGGLYSSYEILGVVNTDVRFIAPDWALFLLVSVLPVIRGVASRCFACGYDLTGNTSGICPECGTPVPKEPAEKSPRTA